MKGGRPPRQTTPGDFEGHRVDDAPPHSQPSIWILEEMLWDKLLTPGRLLAAECSGRLNPLQARPTANATATATAQS